MNKLTIIRSQIDRLDDQILKLLSDRGRQAKLIGRLKRREGGFIHVPAREKSIYDRLMRQNKGPFKTEAVLSIFREIISATRSLEAPIRVSYLGPQATFTHMAAVNHFGSSAELVPSASIQAIFDEVERRHSDYGVVPVENSTEGVVSHTLDLFSASDLNVCAEIVLRVSHHLLSNVSQLKLIRKVYSHPQALAQCRGWLASHLPHAALREVDSTALAAQRAKGERSSAAIASSIAGSVYGLPIVKKEIQDHPQNFTRFLVIGHHISGRTGKDKTSILFTIRDEAGGLYRILAPFARAGINLTKIESRPLKKRAWEYMFFVDLDGHMEDKTVARALNTVAKKCSVFKVLGSYPKSTLVA